jgi:glutamate racemase
MDSGIGGLSVLRQIEHLLPHERLIYACDQIHLPYGERSLEDIQRLTEGITRYLIGRGVKLMVIACNTASGAALHHLRQTFPQMPFVGLEPALKPAAEQTRNYKIGVIATAATFRGQPYARLMEKYAAGMEVFTRPCPELVLLAERGAPWNADDYRQVADILAEMHQAQVDQLVLGCTHFAFLLPLIQAAMPAQTAIIDPAPAVARRVATLLQDHALAAPLHASPSPVEYMTTGGLESFRLQISTLLGSAPQHLQRLQWQKEGSMLLDSESAR